MFNVYFCGVSEVFLKRSGNHRTPSRWVMTSHEEPTLRLTQHTMATGGLTRGSFTDTESSDSSNIDEPSPPGLDFYNSDSSLDIAEENLEVVEKGNSVQPFRFEPPARKSGPGAGHGASSACSASGDNVSTQPTEST